MVFKGGGVECRDEFGQVVVDGMQVVRVIDLDISHRVSALGQRVGKVAHGGKDSNDLLCVMQHIAGLITHLHHDKAYAGIHLLEPGMMGIELIAKDQSQSHAHRVPHCFWYAPDGS